MSERTVGSTKTCTKCGLVKPLDEFHKSEGMKDGHRSDCRDLSHRADSQPSPGWRMAWASGPSSARSGRMVTHD